MSINTLINFQSIPDYSWILVSEISLLAAYLLSRKAYLNSKDNRLRKAESDGTFLRIKKIQECSEKEISSLKKELNMVKQQYEEILQTEREVASFYSIFWNVSGLDELCDKIIKKLVNHVGADRGSIYLSEHEKAQGKLILKGVYAVNGMDEMEYADDQINDCFRTKNATEIISLEKALSEQDGTPGYRLVVPVVLNGDITGVIALNTPKQLLAQEIRFVDKISENLAAWVNIFRKRLHGEIKTNQKIGKIKNITESKKKFMSYPEYRKAHY